METKQPQVSLLALCQSSCYYICERVRDCGDGALVVLVWARRGLGGVLELTPPVLTELSAARGKCPNFV